MTLKKTVNSKGFPNRWIKVTVNQICTTKSGGTPSRNVSEYFGGDVPWIKSGELNDDVLYSCEEYISRKGLEQSNATLYPKNTILLAMYGATIGKVSVLGFPASTNQAICAFSHNSNILYNLYLFYFLKSIRSNLLNISFGGAQKNISQEKIRCISIPIPPLNEQRRIVAKIESIFAQIDAAKERLERLALQISPGSNSLAQLKSSVLKQAFEGKLVPQDPNDEPAKTMLKKLHFDRKELEFENKGIHERWVKIKLSELITVTRGRSYRSAELKKSRNALVTLKSFKQNGGYQSEGLKPYIGPFRNEQIIKPGEIIIAQTDVAQKGYVIGRPAIVSSHPNYDHLIASLDVAIIRNKYDNYLDLKFLYYRLLTPDYIYHTKSYCKGIIVLHLSQNALPSFQLQLPPLSEQHRIVSKIESIFSRIDAIDERVKQSLTMLDSLKKSTLKQAFEGKLVPQDPNDEPAEILLQRINQEKAQPASKPSRRKRNVQ